jgi:hypothetical protein
MLAATLITSMAKRGGETRVVSRIGLMVFSGYISSRKGKSESFLYVEKMEVRVST